MLVWILVESPYDSNIPHNKEYNMIEIIADFVYEYIRAIIGQHNLDYLHDENDIMDYVNNALVDILF